MLPGDTLLDGFEVLILMAVANVVNNRIPEVVPRTAMRARSGSTDSLSGRANRVPSFELFPKPLEEKRLIWQLVGVQVDEAVTHSVNKMPYVGQLVASQLNIEKTRHLDDLSSRTLNAEAETH